MACGGVKLDDSVQATNDVRTQRSAPGPRALEKIAFYLGSVRFGALLVCYKMLAHCWLKLLLSHFVFLFWSANIQHSGIHALDNSLLPRYRWMRRKARMVVLREDPLVFHYVQSGVRASTSDRGKCLGDDGTSGGNARVIAKHTTRGLRVFTIRWKQRRSDTDYGH